MLPECRWTANTGLIVQGMLRIILTMRFINCPLRPVVLVAVCTLFVGCGGEPPPPSKVLESVTKAAESAGVELPLAPEQVAELTQTLQELAAFVDEAKRSKSQFDGASSQGRSRMIQRNLSQFLDGLDRPLPFRSNLERIVEILTESGSDELSESDREAIRTEIQAIRVELGLGDSSDNSFNEGLAPPGPGPPGPPGPMPGGSGPPPPPGR